MAIDLRYFRSKKAVFSWFWHAIMIFLSIVIIGFFIFTAEAATPSRSVDIYFFWGDGCSYCAMAKTFLQDLADKNAPAVQLHSYEVWNHPENEELMNRFATAYHIKARSVPIFFIGNQTWVGWTDQIKAEIEETVHTYMVHGSPTGQSIEPAPAQMAVPAATVDGTITLHLPFFSAVDVNTQPLVLATALIAFIDGVNPCSLWAFTLLLAIVIHAGSRQKAIVVGTTFLAVTAGAYGFFLLAC